MYLNPTPRQRRLRHIRIPGRVARLVADIDGGTVHLRTALRSMDLVPDWQISRDMVGKQPVYRIWSAYRTVSQEGPCFIGTRAEAIAYLRAEWVPDASEWLEQHAAKRRNGG